MARSIRQTHDHDWWIWIVLAGLLLAGIQSLPCYGSERVSLNGEWRFWTDAQTYTSITVPFSGTPRGTILAYEKVFTLANPPADFALMRFDGLAGQATIYLNGVELGRHGSYTPFWFDVSSLLDPYGENSLIVTIDDRASASTVPYEDIPWVNYSGIHRDVYLELAPAATIISVEPQYTFSQDLSHVDGQVTVRLAGLPDTDVSIYGCLLDGSPGNWTIAASLEESSPVSIGSDGMLSASLPFSLDKPQLWSPDSPKLYALHVTAFASGQLQAEQLVQVGFRDVRVQGKDILLNGKPILLKGISRHDIYPGTGFVGTEQQMVEDMQRIKATGANYVRLIHYPHHPRILDLADQLGLLVSEEVPAWANFWDPAVRETLYTMLEEMIQRDMHHPSVFLWISGNARAYPMPYALEAQQLIRRLDRNRLGSYVIDNDQYDVDTIAADVAFFREAQLDLYMKITWWFYYVEYLQDAWVNFPKDVPIVVAEFGREGNDREPIVVDGSQSFWFGEDQQANAISEMMEAWRPHLPAYDADEHITGLCLFNWQDTDWPDIGRYLPNHIPSMHWGLVYDDRTPKQMLQTATRFYSTLPTEFVGLPTPDAGEVQRCFDRPAALDSAVNDSYIAGGPSISTDGRTLYFASDDPQSVSRPRLYFSRKEGGRWTARQLVDMPQETDVFAMRTSPCISHDGKTLYFTRALISGIYITQTRIWQSRLVDGRWSTPTDLGATINFPDASRSTSDPSISADGNTLYFSSDRPGGQGRSDLWVSRRVDGEWTEPANLGSAINSEYADREPCILPDSRTLYFSSDRPGGLGSSDIWVSHLVNGQWAAPRNLGPELNSPGADREPEVAKNGRTLHFTGIRSGGHGLSDLWTGDAIVKGDINRDGRVDAADLPFFLSSWSSRLGTSKYDSRCDLNSDGKVNVFDLCLLVGNWGKST